MKTENVVKILLYTTKLGQIVKISFYIVFDTDAVKQLWSIYDQHIFKLLLYIINHD